MTSQHPWVREFAHLLARETDPAAPARARAFARIVEACADDRGLPTLAGLRRLEAGHHDERLGAAWRPLFIDAYRRWIGHRFDREMSRGPRPLSLVWWFSPPARWRGSLPEPLRVILAPLLPLLVVAAMVVVGLAAPLSWARHASSELRSLRQDVVLAQRAEVEARRELERRLPLATDEDVSRLHAAWATWDAATAEAERSGERLAAALDAD